MREDRDELLARDDGRLDRVGGDATVSQEPAHLRALPAKDPRGVGGRGRLSGDRDRPPDEIRADRDARGGGDAQRVARMTDVVDRRGEDVRRQYDRNRDREQAEEQLGKLDPAAPTLHAREDDARR